MTVFSNCKEAVQHCITQKTFSVAYLFSEEKTMNLHVHDCYELYFSIAGGKKFLIGGQCYGIEPGDLFVINQYESHYLQQVDAMAHERIVLSIYPAYLQQLSSAQTDLTACFRRQNRAGENRLRLEKDAQKRFIYYVHKITSTRGFGEDLLSEAALVELMVLVNQKFLENQSITAEQPFQYNELVTKIIEYINQHITEPLALDRLAAAFFISKSYLCRIFKLETGTTIVKYLTARRISIAKFLLAQGSSVTATCEDCGFNDYANFVKSFTKLVGISPKQYALGWTSR